jgi:integrase/recombinase XerD
MADFAAQTMKDPKGYLTKEQVEKLISSAENLRDQLILTLMYRCGRRVSEVLLLTEDDILWEDKKIIFTILKRKRPVKELKPVDEYTLKLLDVYINGNIAMKGIRKRFSGGKLFPVTRQHVFKMIRKLGEKVGITQVGSKRLHPHHLRHSFAVHAVRTEVKTAEDLRKLQMYMGHANISTTSHYLQYSPEELRSLIDGMWGKKGGKK